MSLLKILYIDDHEKNDCTERPGVRGRGQHKEISENAVRFSALRNTKWKSLHFAAHLSYIIANCSISNVNFPVKALSMGRPLRDLNMDDATHEKNSVKAVQIWILSHAHDAKVDQ
jgi:hypothetical protein